MSMDLFIARSLVTKASLDYKGLIDIRETQVHLSFHFNSNCLSFVYESRACQED